MLINVTLKVYLWQRASGLCPWPFPCFYQLLEFKKKSESMLIKFVGDTLLGGSLKRVQTHTQRNGLEVIESI